MDRVANNVKGFVFYKRKVDRVAKKQKRVKNELY